MEGDVGLRAFRWGRLMRWLALGAALGAFIGSASALFLSLLDVVTTARVADEHWVYGLPLAGLFLGAVFERYGQSIQPGTNLVIDTIHDGGPELPLRMAPMVLLGTVVSHLFGASVGREGTAVQVGASLTDWFSHRLRLESSLRLQLLSAGVAGGFGSVFGTPLAGAIFGLEFVVLGRMKYDALIPALTAAVVGDWTTRAWGIQHTAYPPVALVALTPSLALRWMLFAFGVAAAAMVFIELTHFLKRHFARVLPWLSVRMLVGGLVVVGLWRATGGSEFLGLGVPTIVRAFEDASLPAYTFAFKLVLTALCIGAGFPGGEVTPLFFIGATLGSAMSAPLGIPVSLGAAVGMSAVFAACSNAPLALSVMAVELVGVPVLPHVFIVASLAYFLSGQRSIYSAQRKASAG